jgi:hypothetical protein
VKVYSLENAYVVEKAQVVKNTEGSNEAIVIGEMVDTPPGPWSMACCPKDFVGTWEDLCLPPKIMGGVPEAEETRPGDEA